MNCVVSHQIPIVKMSERDGVTPHGQCQGSRVMIGFYLLTFFLPDIQCRAEFKITDLELSMG